ncbi:MAG: FG-GAP-like repeat-containing protein, partial [Thermoanaerobaculia bacterium]
IRVLRPGRDRPGRDRPGRDRPGRDRPGRDRPGRDRPGRDRPPTGSSGEAAVHRGAEGLVTALRELPGIDAAEMRFKLKVVAVELEADAATTRLLFSLTAPTAGGGSVEHHVTWEARWTRSADGETPRLRSLRILDDYQEAHYQGGGHPTWFSDQTAAVLAGTEAFEHQLMRGTWSWLGELEAALGHDFAGHSGIAVGDVDGDGLEDLYVGQSGGLPNRLFLRRPDGSVRERSAWAGVDWLDRTHGALLIDLDDDGDKDLAVATAAALLMMENDGSGRFALRADFEDFGYAYSLAAADFDLDGDLDLYATRYNPLHDELGAPADVPTPLPYHDAENGARNVLLKNDGDWRFTDATEATGLDADNRRWSFAASWEDYDNDGDPDLYVANDFGRNCLYRNDRTGFVNVAPAAGVEDVASGMSVAWGDADRDGWMDLYVGNMFSSAGNRITYQRRFQPEMADATRSLVQRLARGNSLYLNRGRGGEFVDASVSAGVTMGRWAWGSIFADLNNDGWQDLVVANGYLTTPDSGDL